MYGQTRIEFIFGIVIFSIIIFYVVNQVNTVFSSIISNYEINNLRAEANSVIKTLVGIGDIEKFYEYPIPVDVMLVNDISGSMDGQTYSWGESCRLPCDSFGNPPQCNPNGCKNGDPGYPDSCACPLITDCDNNGKYADPEETPCAINDAKNASKIFVDEIDPANDTSGLVAFNKTAYLLQNLTNETQDVKDAIDTMVGGGTTAVGEGIYKATEEFINNGRTYANWVQILLTDGRTNAGRKPEYAAQNASEENITIYTIGLGEPSYYNETLLKLIASMTGGKYYHAPDSTKLGEIYKEIATEIKREIIRSGLIAKYPYNVSKEKVDNLKQNCDRMNIFFGIRSYRLKIYNSTDLLLFCGTDTLKPPKVFVSKYVLVENDSGNITLEMW